MALTKEKNNIDLKAYYTGKGHKWAVFGAGAFAAATMTLLMVGLLYTGITPRSMANLLADKIATFFPGQVQEFFIQSIGPLGKGLLFYGILVGQVAVGGLLALFMFWLWPQIPDKASLWRNSFIISTGFWALFTILALPLLDAGFLGEALGSSQLVYLITSFLLFQVFGVALGFYTLKLLPVTNDTQAVVTKEEAEDEEYNGVSRRRFVIGLSAFFLAALAVGIGAGALKVKNTNYWTSLGEEEIEGGKLTGEVTPTETFYDVSKNVINPVVQAEGWTLQILGKVNQPTSFDYTTIRKLPVVSTYHTLTCISNPVGGQLIGNGEWKGTSLRDILQTAGVQPGAKKVVFTAADGYQDSIDIEKALDPQTLLVWEMNGAPLNDKHGFPIRALIPGIYGMKNVKWIKEIRVIDTEFEGFWQKQGWDNPAPIKTESTISFPSTESDVKSGEKITVRGFAYAGNRGIEKIEVSADGGKSWQEAKIKAGLSQNTWQFWQLDWTPQGAGKSIVMAVRATDGTGQTQTNNQADPYPSGANGWHSINLRIV